MIFEHEGIEYDTGKKGVFDGYFLDLAIGDMPKLQKKTEKILKRMNVSGVRAAQEFMRYRLRVVEKDLPDHIGAFFLNEEEMVMNKNMPEGEKFWAIVHEIVHIRHNDPWKGRKFGRLWHIFGNISLNEVRREYETKRYVKSFIRRNR